MKVYVVNETCELENDVYTNCHGVFTDKKKAVDIADKSYYTALDDINNAESCYEELAVWNSVSRSVTVVEEKELI